MNHKIVTVLLCTLAIIFAFQNCIQESRPVNTTVSTSGSFSFTGKSSIINGTVSLYRDSNCTNFITSAPISNYKWNASFSISANGVYPIYGKDTDPKYPDCTKVATVEKVGSMVGSYRGGSNYFWYHAEGCPPNQESDFWNYGILRNYAKAGIRPLVKQGLKDMYESGQRRIRTGLYHARGEGGATSLDSTGGNIKPEYITNLKNFLADIYAAGFEEIIFGYFPMGNNNPQQYTLSEDYFQENWNVIVNTRPLLVNSGLKYIIDLANEGSPWDNPGMMQYAQRLWANYTYTYGKGDTEGFSIIPIDAVFNNLTTLYNGNYPNVWDLHFYGEAGGLTPDQIYNAVKTQYVNTNNKLNNLKINREWIIGETFYNGDGIARALRDGANQTGKKPRFVIQWPLTSGQCRNNDVGIPNQFSFFVQNGF